MGAVAVSVERWADLVEDFTTFFEHLVSIVRRHLGKQFDTEGGYASGGWDELLPAYAAWKEENFPGRPILVLTGALRSAAVDGGPGSLERIQPRLLEVGVDGEAIPYARAHQAGEGVPQRPVFEVTNDFRDVVVRLYHAFVVWARKSAMDVDDPFLDERFESRMEMIAASSTGDESALEAVFRAGMAAFGSAP